MQEVARRITKQEIRIQLSITHTKHVAEAIVTIEVDNLQPETNPGQKGFSL
jgi:phosphopantetheinyl transferase (holo-ACP synthase)